MEMNYKDLLEEAYQQTWVHTPNRNKLLFAGEYVFNFTTYDDNVSEAFAGLMLEVIGAILNKSTFEYQDKSEQHYINYLIMVNMPFLKDKLEWGGSVRGAWLDESAGEPYLIYDISVPRTALSLFFMDLFTWLNQDDKA